MHSIGPTRLGNALLSRDTNRRHGDYLLFYPAFNFMHKPMIYKP
jgi:hypothetical protein